MSVSKENSTSDSSRWCMYDHLNSGILKGGRVGPGLNIGRVEGFPCFDLLASARKERICKNIDTLLLTAHGLIF